MMQPVGAPGPYQPPIGQPAPPQQGGGGYQQQPGMIPQYNPAQGAHPATVGYGDYPSPGEIHLTGKQYYTRLAVLFLAGFVAGGVVMFRLFPVIVSVVQAVAGV